MPSKFIAANARSGCDSKGIRYIAVSNSVATRGLRVSAMKDTGSSHPDSLACILFTSGSTGDPKGVEIEHRSLVHALHSLREAMAAREDDCYFFTTSLGFDVAAIEIFLPLVTGASISVASPQILLNARELSRRIRKDGVTVVQGGQVNPFGNVKQIPAG